MLITAARLFDGRGDSIVNDPLIAVEDGRIVGVTSRSASLVDSPDLLDLGGVTVLPGLIDVHQHLAFDASADPVTRLADVDDATLLLRMRVAAMRALAGGVTTIRDLGDRNYVSLTLRDWFRSGRRSARQSLRRGLRSPSPVGIAGSSAVRLTARRASGRRYVSTPLVAST